MGMHSTKNFTGTTLFNKQHNSNFDTLVFKFTKIYWTAFFRFLSFIWMYFQANLNDLVLEVRVIRIKSAIRFIFNKSD